MNGLEQDDVQAQNAFITGLFGLARFPAALPRSDLPPVLGLSGERRFGVATSDLLQDGEPHMIRAYGLNSEPKLPGRPPRPTEHLIECPHISPTLAPTPTQADIALPTDLAMMTKPATVEPEATAEPVPEGRRLPCIGAGLPLLAGASFWSSGRRRR